MAVERLGAFIEAAKSPFKGGRVGGAAFNVGAEVANVITVGVQLRGQSGKDLAQRGKVDWFLSDDANGDSVVATAPDGGVAAGTDGWVTSLVTGKCGWAGSESDGDIDIAITHAAGAKTCYLVIVDDFGNYNVSGAITFAA